MALRAVSRRFKHSASRGTAAIVATILITAAGMSLAAAENDCKTSFFGLCTNRFTESEQAQINARRWLEAQLRDPARSGPVLEQRLRKQVRYSNGLLLITDPILHGVTTLPATATWTISCDTWSVSVTFAGTEVELVPIGTNIAANACYRISGLLGEAVLRLTSGQ